MQAPRPPESCFLRMGLVVDIPNKFPCAFNVCPRFTERMLRGSAMDWVGIFPDGTYSLSSHLEGKGDGKNAQEMDCADFFH